MKPTILLMVAMTWPLAGCTTKQDTNGANGSAGNAANGSAGSAGAAGSTAASAGVGGTGGAGGVGGEGGSAGGGAAGTGGTGGSGGTSVIPDPCAGGTPDPSPTASFVSGHGFVELDTSPDNPIVSFVTTLVVPPQPPPSGTLFLWPGLQPLPGGANYDPIDNGVLQPVLTWGPTCAPNAPASMPYADWWVSAQYVNTIGHEPGFTGCQGGQGMAVAVGDTLTMTFLLDGTSWSQTVTSQMTGASVSFDFDVQGQSQNRAELVIEPYDSEPTVPIQFGPSVITFTNSAPDSCHIVRQGTTDVVAIPVSSPDGKTCCISSVTLNAQ